MFLNCCFYCCNSISIISIGIRNSSRSSGSINIGSSSSSSSVSHLIGKIKKFQFLLIHVTKTHAHTAPPTISRRNQTRRNETKRRIKLNFELKQNVQNQSFS